jgi:hypothetical protein
MGVFEVVRTAALVLLALSVAWIAAHGVTISVYHTGPIALSCLIGTPCPRRAVVPLKGVGF